MLSPIVLKRTRALFASTIICVITVFVYERENTAQTTISVKEQDPIEYPLVTLTLQPKNISSVFQITDTNADCSACFKDINRISSPCGPCQSRAVSFDTKSDRCTCSQCKQECLSCHAVLSSSDSRSLLLHPNPPHHLGFTTQLNDVFGHLADACLKEAHLLYGGFKLDALNLSSPLVPVDTLFSVEAVNTMLSTHANCSRSRLLPWHCSEGLLRSHFTNIQCTRNIHWTNKKEVKMFAPQIVQSFPLKLERAYFAVVASKLSTIPAAFNAVHFNLDCDWLLYLERRLARSGNVEFYDRYKKVKELNFSMTYCSQGMDVSIGKVAKKYIQGYVNATRHMGHDLPILLATSIGKTGHTSTSWVLEAYKKNLGPKYVFYESGSSSIHRELNAAAELKLLLAAKKFIGLSLSTFSNLVAQRISVQSEESSNNNIFMADRYL